jgi:hypothetical protein
MIRVDCRSLNGHAKPRGFARDARSCRDPRSITHCFLCANAVPTEVQQRALIVGHEIGHYVFFLAIGSRVKKRWVTELLPGSPCGTACAGKNPWEEKHAFRRDYVFSGNPETLKERDRVG